RTTAGAGRERPEADARRSCRHGLAGAGLRPEAYFRFAVISIIFISSPVGPWPNISMVNVLSSAQVIFELVVVFLPVIGSHMSPLCVQTLPASSQVPVEYMMPVPMLSIQELTYILATLS